MTNPLYTFDQLPTDSAALLREFDDRYIAALGASQATGWADTLGALVPTNAPMVTFPVSQLFTRFYRTTGESRFKDMGNKSFDVKAEEFDAGYEAKLYDLFKQVFAYRRWQEAPGRLVVAEEQFRHDQVAANIIEANASNGIYTLFSATQPINIMKSSLGTFSNLQTSAKTVLNVANIEAEVTAMMVQVKDENGKKLGVKPNAIAVPLELAHPLENMLKKEMLVIGSATAPESSPYKLSDFQVIPMRELTDVNDWFLIDTNLARELPPWVIMRETVPAELQTRTFDSGSDFTKHSGKIAYSKHIWYGFSAGFPHAIRKVVGA